MKKNIATVSDLKKMSVSECQEALVSLNDLPLLCHTENHDMFPYTSDQIFVREGVRKRLERAQNLLGHDFQLFINYGYRHPQVQESYWKEMFAQMQQANASLSQEALIEKTHLFIAYPPVAGHPTGAAIDVTLYYKGKEVDMGGHICDFDRPELIPTFSKEISKEQAVNRMKLHDLLVAVGFAPFYGEWWHFSYGDREWAVFYKQPTAIYDVIS